MFLLYSSREFAGFLHGRQDLRFMANEKWLRLDTLITEAIGQGQQALPTTRSLTTSRRHGGRHYADQLRIRSHDARAHAGCVDIFTFRWGERPRELARQ